MTAATDIPVSAIIVAAGSGQRLGAGIRKQYLRLAGRTIVGHTLSRFDACPEVGSITLVVPAADIEYCRKQILPEIALRSPISLIAGGEQRQDSVLNALQALGEKRGLVAVHDGVRPLVEPELISLCIRCAAQFGACVALCAPYDFRLRPNKGSPPRPRRIRWLKTQGLHKSFACCRHVFWAPYISYDRSWLGSNSEV